MAPDELVFDDGNRAVAVTGDRRDARSLVAAAGLPADGGRPVIVVCGGADDLTGDALAAAEAVVGDGVARAAGTTGAAVVDGGTDAGVMALVGQARRERRDALPTLVGVAPAGRVARPGEPAGDRVPLEPAHTHFLLADSDEWGGETELLFDVAATLARHPGHVPGAAARRGRRRDPALGGRGRAGARGGDDRAREPAGGGQASAGFCSAPLPSPSRPRSTATAPSPASTPRSGCPAPISPSGRRSWPAGSRRSRTGSCRPRPAAGR